MIFLCLHPILSLSLGPSLCFYRKQNTYLQAYGDEVVNYIFFIAFFYHCRKLMTTRGDRAVWILVRLVSGT